MGWETRERGGLYYYRKERQGDRVRSVYVGAGIVGEFANLQSELDSERKEAEREALRREIATQDEIDARIDDLCRITSSLVRGALIAAGFHQHKRQWRRKR